MAKPHAPGGVGIQAGGGDIGPCRARRSLVVLLALIGTGVTMPSVRAATRTAARGFNMIEKPDAPFGSAAAARSFEAMAAIGADHVALIPFLWQASENDPNILYGDAVPLARLRAAIGQARTAGLSVIVKPHVWVPERWAGSVAMRSEADWATWFAAYRAVVAILADVARDEGAQTLVIGTELRRTSGRAEWAGVIDAARSRFPGRLTYVAHGAEEAEKIPFWRQLDAVSVSLYPSLGGDADREAWKRAMRGVLLASRKVADRNARPLWIGEIGIRSAVGAAMRPWESAEERRAAPDQALQRSVLRCWLDTIGELDAADLILVWRWFSDPHAGGAQDTDFTVQNKAAARMLRSRWIRN
ncbi:hypothetical protein KY084_14040 [Stakelama sp. CBK3Z-3]|uniref:Glycosidase-like protein n=1 Tax=Stakelama flava TaxID=2860338 RepID=A0ABS6XP45_9SPHN|nr:hypothetical protein [Stakelama flava]MBW4331988.1 hypothetical protein [Stakelama flava]